MKTVATVQVCNCTWNIYTGTSLCISILSDLFPKHIVKHESNSPHNVSSNICNQQTQYKCSY